MLLKQVVYFFYLLAVLLISFSCTHFSQTSLPYFPKHNIEIHNLPFFPQEKWQCGPASLASVLNYRGIDISPEILKEQVFLPQKKGSLQIELKGAVRNANLIPYQLEGGLENLFKEIEAGNPVIVLQNLGFNWLPTWHYAVVKGFNADKQKLILNSGKIENYELDVSTFMLTWERANYWGITIMPANQLPATGSPEKIIKEIHVLEQIGKTDFAHMAYQAVLNLWPDESQALFSEGNYYFSKKQIKESQQAFERIVLKNPNNIAAWNNLAYVYAEQHCRQHAYNTLNHALEIASPNEKKVLQSSLEDLAVNSSSKNARQCSTITLPF